MHERNYANHLLWSYGQYPNVLSSYFFNILLTVSPAGQICELRAANLCFSEVFAVELPQTIPALPAVHCVQESPFKGTEGRQRPPASLFPPAAHQPRGAHLTGERTANTYHLAQPPEQDTTAELEPQHKNSPKVRK